MKILHYLIFILALVVIVLTTMVLHGPIQEIDEVDSTANYSDEDPFHCAICQFSNFISGNEPKISAPPKHFYDREEMHKIADTSYTTAEQNVSSASLETNESLEDKLPLESLAAAAATAKSVSEKSKKQEDKRKKELEEEKAKKEKAEKEKAEKKAKEQKLKKQKEAKAKKEAKKHKHKTNGKRILTDETDVEEITLDVHLKGDKKKRKKVEIVPEEVVMVEDMSFDVIVNKKEETPKAKPKTEPKRVVKAVQKPEPKKVVHAKPKEEPKRVVQTKPKIEPKKVVKATPKPEPKKAVKEEPKVEPKKVVIAKAEPTRVTPPKQSYKKPVEQVVKNEPKKEPVKIASATPLKPAPKKDYNAKTIYAKQCRLCHGNDRRFAEKFTSQRWNKLFDNKGEELSVIHAKSRVSKLTDKYFKNSEYPLQVESFRSYMINYAK